MALVKKHKKQEIKEFKKLTTLDDAIELFLSSEDFEEKSYSIKQMPSFDNGASYLVEILKDISTGKAVDAEAATVLSNMDADDAPIEEIMQLLKLHNAYIRNLGIQILQDYGEAIKYYIVKFLIGDDRDLRIFAINVLGDVNFAESRDMLVELLETEEDINVAMTAVDYMAEIGECDDIAVLEKIKERFKDDVYVQFGVDGAIRSIKG